MQVVFITMKRIISFIAATNTAENYLSSGDGSRSDNCRNCKGAADMLSSNVYCRADDEKNLSPGLSSAKISLHAYSNSTLDFQTMKRAVETLFRLAFSYCGIFHSPQLDSKEFQ